jgi:hypothetical protein
MAIDRSPRQLDLFGDAVKIPPAEPTPVDFMAHIRDELTGTLGRLLEAAALPWKDLTAATLDEALAAARAEGVPLVGLAIQ